MLRTSTLHLTPLPLFFPRLPFSFFLLLLCMHTLPPVTHIPLRATLALLALSTLSLARSVLLSSLPHYSCSPTTPLPFKRSLSISSIHYRSDSLFFCTLFHCWPLLRFVPTTHSNSVRVCLAENKRAPSIHLSSYSRTVSFSLFSFTFISSCSSHSLYLRSQSCLLHFRFSQIRRTTAD